MPAITKTSLNLIPDVLYMIEWVIIVSSVLQKEHSFVCLIKQRYVVFSLGKAPYLEFCTGMILRIH